MLAVVLHELGGPEKLVLQEVPDPEPGPGEVRVRLRAAALNHRDLWIRIGRYAKIQLPTILGSDGAGVVDAVGEGVDPAWVGREVIVDPSLDWGPDPRVQDPRTYRILGMPDPGTYAQYVCVPATNVVPKPEHLDFHEAAALPLAGLTAWRAVVTKAEVAAGERVLVTGIGGGVATMALLFAHARGAEVWVTSGSGAKIERAVELGARGGVSYRDPEWPRALVELAGGEMDAAIDGTGGGTLADLVAVAAYAGRIVHYGATLGNPDRPFDLRRLFWRQLRILGTTMGTHAEFEAMVAFVAQQRLRPVVDRVFPLAEVAEAHRRMEAARQLGKIVLEIP